MRNLAAPGLALFLLMLGGCETATAPSPSVLKRPAAPLTSPALDISEVDRKPVPRKRVAPYYPSDMRSRGIRGETVLEFIVDTKGDVVNASVVSATNEAFGQAAADAIVKWKFMPAMKDGQPVNARMRQMLYFEVNE